MTRLLLILLGTIAPSERFPALWARWNRLAPSLRLGFDTLSARLRKPGFSLDDAIESARTVVDRLAEADARVTAVLDERFNEFLALADSWLAALEGWLASFSSPQGALTRKPTVGETPLIGAAAASALAALLVSMAGVMGPGRPGAPPVASPHIAVQHAVAMNAASGEQATAAPEAPAAPAASQPAATPAPQAVPEPAQPAAAAVSSNGLPGGLPLGKGMWLYLPERVEGGDPHAIVAKAKAVGLTHVYVRTGSSKMGFYAQDFLNQLLPVAHENGLRVIGWDFPYFYSWSDDVFRAVEAIRYTTPDGHRIDGFSADIETESEGTVITANHAHEYGAALRRFVGDSYPLIATVPRPSNRLMQTFPYAELAPHFDAFAPMVYWMNRDPVTDVTGAMDYLAQFGRPVIPVGQAYDGAPEGGPPGVPSAEAIIRFMQAAQAKGAPGVSFWSWQHADAQAWEAIRVAAEFRLAPGLPAELTPGMVVAYQTQLNQFGFAVPITGQWDDATTAAVRAFQARVGLPLTGVMDGATFDRFHAPVPPPLLELLRGR